MTPQGGVEIYDIGLFAVDIEIKIFILNFFVGPIRPDLIDGLIEQFHQVLILFAAGDSFALAEPAHIRQIRADEFIIFALRLFQKSIGKSNAVGQQKIDPTGCDIQIGFILCGIALDLHILAVIVRNIAVMSRGALNTDGFAF